MYEVHALSRHRGFIAAVVSTDDLGEANERRDEFAANPRFREMTFEVWEQGVGPVKAPEPLGERWARSGYLTDQQAAEVRGQVMIA